MRSSTRALGSPWLAGMLLLAISQWGCAPKYDDLKAFLPTQDHEIAAAEYRVQPPDLIAVNSPTAPEIDGDSQRIRADGKVTLRLLGEVKVAGMTPREISAKLEELLATYYVEPKVSVRVLGFDSRKLFVFGEVANPGPRPFTGRDTVLDVLAESLPNRNAWGAQVKVIRPGASDDKRHEIVVNIDRIMQTGDLQQNFLLQDGDIVYVPPTPMAWVGQQLQSILYPVDSAASLYSSPAAFIAATDYYRNHESSNTYVRFSPGGARP